jgi:aspartate racemase
MSIIKGSKIGIVSGVGPLAGSDVLAKTFNNAAEIYGAIEDCEYPDLILLNHGIDGIDNTASLNDKFETEIAEMVISLEQQGCNIIGIACNTAHLYLDKIKTKEQTKLINLIDTVSKVASVADKKYLLLTSSASKQNKLYHGYLVKHKVAFDETTTEQQNLIDTTIGLIMAYKLDEAGEIMQQVIDSANSQGYDAIIAGCTELPIAITRCKNLYGMSAIDSNDELAKAMLKSYYKNY